MSKILTVGNKRSLLITVSFANSIEGSDLIAEALISGLDIIFCK